MPLFQEIEMRTRGAYKHDAPDKHIFLPLEAKTAEIIHKAADEGLSRMCMVHQRKKTRDMFNKLFSKKYL